MRYTKEFLLGKTLNYFYDYLVVENGNDVQLKKGNALFPRHNLEKINQNLLNKVCKIKGEIFYEIY